MSTSEIQTLRPNAGNRLRSPAAKPRKRFLETDVTAQEHQQIMEYCFSNKISVSQFLADLILEDAATAKIPKAAVTIDDFQLSGDDYEKLELLAHLYKKSSVSELIRDLLQAHLDLRRHHIPNGRTRSLRFYLDEREHRTVTQHIASRGTTARKYVSYLAVRTITKAGKSRKIRSSV